MITSAFGDLQVVGVLDGHDDGGADGGQVAGPLPVRLAAVLLATRNHSFGAELPAGRHAAR